MCEKFRRFGPEGSQSRLDIQRSKPRKTLSCNALCRTYHWGTAGCDHLPAPLAVLAITSAHIGCSCPLSSIRSSWPCCPRPVELLGRHIWSKGHHGCLPAHIEVVRRCPRLLAATPRSIACLSARYVAEVARQPGPPRSNGDDLQETADNHHLGDVPRIPRLQATGATRSNLEESRSKLEEETI